MSKIQQKVIPIFFMKVLGGDLLLHMPYKNYNSCGSQSTTDKLIKLAQKRAIRV